MKILTTALYSFIIEVLWILNTVRYNWSLRVTPSTVLHLHLLSSHHLRHLWPLLAADWSPPFEMTPVWRMTGARCWYWLSVLTRLLSEVGAGPGMWSPPGEGSMSPEIITLINIEIFWRLHHRSDDPLQTLIETHFPPRHSEKIKIISATNQFKICLGPTLSPNQSLTILSDHSSPRQTRPDLQLLSVLSLHLVWEI